MCESSVDSAFRNLRRAGMLKNRSRTVIDVPSGSPASSTRRILPPAISMTVPAASSGARVSSRKRRDRSDGRQRLAAESQRGDGQQVFGIADLRGGVALEGQHGVVAHHAAAVVGDLDELLAAGLDVDANAVAPASSEFSSSSFTTDAGRSTTSPAAILLATFSERTWMRPMKAVLSSQFSVLSCHVLSSQFQSSGHRVRPRELGWQRWKNERHKNAGQWRRRSGKRSARNREKRIYGVTLRVNFTELVSAAPPPVVAFTVKGKEPVGVPGSLLLLVPPHEAIHSVERLSITSIAKCAESRANACGNRTGTRCQTSRAARPHKKRFVTDPWASAVEPWAPW